MKQLLKFLVFLSIAALAGSAFAAAGWLGAGAIYIGEKVEEGVCNGWYYADSHSSTTWCNGGPFGGADLGSLTSLTLGGQVQLWDENSADWGWGATAKMYYSIDGAAAQLITLDYYSFHDNNNFFQSGGDPMVATEVSLAGLDPGVHTLAIYFDDYDSRKTTATYTANFTIPESKTVTFDGNGEGVVGVPDTLTCYVGGVYKVGGIPSPTRPNYRFRGWFTDPDDGEGERIRGFTIVEDANPMTLWAHWERGRQTVTFNANDGGAGAVLVKNSAKFDQGGTYSGTIFTMSGATWANHKFLGWYDQPEGGSPVKWGDTVTSEATRTLYAHWRTFRQTVTFDANDGGAGATLVKTTAKFDQGGIYSGAVFSMTAATWDGHTFLGWFPIPKGGDRVKWGDTVTSEDARTLYAHWRTDAPSARRATTASAEQVFSVDDCGVFPLGSYVVEVTPDEPTVEELADREEAEELDSPLVVTFQVPAESVSWQFWSAERGILAEEAVESSTISLQLPDLGLWHWVRFFDGDGGMLSSTWLFPADTE